MDLNVDRPSMFSRIDSSRYVPAEWRRASSSQGRTTSVYSSLQLFRTLRTHRADVYSEFEPYVLTDEQLHNHGFPVDSPNQLGRTTMYRESGATDPTQRCCVRCKDTFYILDDGTYHSETSCRFHPKKLTAGIYDCCYGNPRSEGCTTWHFHVTAERSPRDVEFVKTREKQELNRNQSRTVYALDCEMCYTTGGLEVAKIGIVGMDGLPVYESFVLPEHPILDYNTVYSGITASDLRGVSTTLYDVQTFLLKLLNKDSILVGHGLENDLKALRLMHHKVVDTSVVFPHYYGNRYKRSLKSLALEYLNKSIQESTNGHDCIEDARTCMELMLWRILYDSSHVESFLLRYTQECHTRDQDSAEPTVGSQEHWENSRYNNEAYFHNLYDPEDQEYEDYDIIYLDLQAF